jgi:FixJ family two-component response regulator
MGHRLSAQSSGRRAVPFQLAFTAHWLIMNAKSPTVFIVDDEEALRTSLRNLLESIGISVMTFASAREFLGGDSMLQPGCLLLDIRMPGMSGIELQQQLNMQGAIIPVIFVTGHGDVPMAVQAMKHGALDFLQKPFRTQDLVDRVQRALAKDAENHAALAQHAQIRARLASLTSREREVLNLMTRGKSNKIMAADLGISQRTVEIHRAHVMEKLAASSVAQAVRMVMDVGAAAASR